MEEVDTIILQILKQLDIEIPDRIKSLCELSADIIVESASKCLCSINPNLKLPTKLPAGISHRIEVSALVASACKDIGFKSDVGYQTFLYHNESELRQVFMFLIEHLPNKGDSTTAVVPSNKKSIFYQKIGNKITEELNKMWIPPNYENGMSPSEKFTYSELIKKKLSRLTNITNETLIAHLVKVSNMKIDKTESCGSIINEPALSKDSLQPDSESKTEIKNVAISKSLKELKESAIMLRQKLNVLESEKNVMNVEYQQINKSCEKVGSELKNVENILQSIGLEGVDDDTDLGNVLEAVQSNIDFLHTKNEKLTSKSLEFKMEIDKLKNSGPLSQSERAKCCKILLSLKENAKAMKEEYTSKQELHDKLKRCYDKLRGGNKRSIYTKRILEIIGNVDKQNLEIKKILEDTRQIQKEINSLDGQLGRCFSVADETLFKDAKKDDQAKKAYKLLALLHSECNTIVSLVNDTGTLSRDIVDLEDNIKAEKTKRTEDTLQKIQQDISRIKEESDSPR